MSLRRQLHRRHPTSTSKTRIFYFLVCSLLLSADAAEISKQSLCLRQHPPVDLFAVCHVRLFLQRWSCGCFDSNNCSHNFFRKTPHSGSFVWTHELSIVTCLSFFNGWTDLNTWIRFSLFIQPALCFYSAMFFCFFYGSHVLCLQLRDEFP